MFVHETLFDQFVERYVQSVSALEVGIPTSGADMGPLASAQQLAKAAEAVSTATREGATLVAGGGRPQSGELSDEGYWFAPTVFVDVDPSMTVMREETFGPITPILAIESLDEAVSLANDSRYGLSAYLFSRDYQAVLRAVDELQFGEIYVNRTLGESVHAHHSGYRESGIGGEDGKWGLMRYTQVKTVYHHYGE